MNNENLLINVIWPFKKTSILIKNIALVFFGTFLITISAKIQVPFWPVPMTMQTFAVLIIAMAYGWKLSVITLALYLIEGAMGIPVFAKGGGYTYLIGPTSGYLYGMLIASGVVGFFGDKGYGKNILTCLIPLCLGSIIIFVLGVGYLASLIGLEKAIQGGLLPFIPSEFFKIALAAILIPMLWTLFKKNNLN